MGDKKPEVGLLPGEPTEKELLDLHEMLTGRKATEREIAVLRAGMAKDAKEAKGEP
jgi:hypothetical protein